MQLQPQASSELLQKFVVEGLQEIKGENITILDLREIDNAERTSSLLLKVTQTPGKCTLR